MASHDILTTAALSDPGRVRANNEDAVAVCSSTGLVVLADGMGGHNAGEIASGTAVTTVNDSIRRWHTNGRVNSRSSANNPAAMLKHAVETAHAEICKLSQSREDYQGMGTTVVAALFHADRISIAHVGDSRFYLLRDGQLQQITRDHSLAEELVRSGRYTREQAAEQVSRNTITRALGVNGRVEVELTETSSRVGDIALLCSDGLYTAVPADQIREVIINSAVNLNAACRVLIDMANASGGEDNISVILARVERSAAISDSWYHRLGNWFSGS